MGSDDGEQLLTGGTTPGVVRVGDTVRRPVHGRTPYVHAVLRHLESVGFAGAPRVLGVDEQGRETLSYLEGSVIDVADLSEDQLRSAAALIRRFHDATAGTDLADGDEVVLHGDLGPHNMVFAGSRAVGLIDWDESVAPGPRIRDVGHAVWCFADIGEGGGTISAQARRAQVFCDAYGWSEPGQVVDEITERFRRATADHSAAGRDGAVAVFADLTAWMERSAPALKAQLT